jgi:nitronate monooxygenase
MPVPKTPVLSGLSVPVVLAPMAGGPSTPPLAAAVNRGGGLGFLAAGYLSAQRLQDNITTLRSLSNRPFGVNVFIGGGREADRAGVDAYARRLSPLAESAGVTLGEPRSDDDAFNEKIGLLTADPVAVVSFTFGPPPRASIEALHAVGSEVWLTVTSPSEAAMAAELGADALIVQGVEAGGHRGVFVDNEDQSDLTLLAALQLVRSESNLPLIAAGAIMTGPALGAVLVAGASAAQLGTAYLRSVEAGTSEAQREATATALPTLLTRAFSGRLARGIRNRWHDEHGAHAPRAYPEIHHLTSALRAHGRAVGDPDLVNLWAGQAHQLAQDLSAAQITATLGREALAAISAAARPEAG